MSTPQTLPPLSNAPTKNIRSSGTTAALLAFLIWGTLVFYWKPLGHVPATDVLAYRIIWSLLTLCPLIYFTGRWSEIRIALRQARTMLYVLISALVIAANWGLYIWAVGNNQIMEASLGYFINPLVSVVIGRILLNEKMIRLQSIAVGIATLGALWSVWVYGHMPWLALALAVCFAIYGFFRKIVSVGSLSGLFLETLCLFPLALLWLIWRHFQGIPSFFAYDLNTCLLLMGTGIVTITPLILFAYAARHITLTTVGLLQYISPTIMFLLGIFIFNEEVTSAHMVTFSCIWIALLLYTWGGLRQWNSLRKH